MVGDDGNGAFLPAGPLLVYEQLPESNPVRKSAAEYVTRYEAKYGAGSRTTFGGHAWDAYMLLQRAIPEALKQGQPGTQAFRDGAARRAGERRTRCRRATACSTSPPSDHNGFDNRARVMVQDRQRQVAADQVTAL